MNIVFSKSPPPSFAPLQIVSDVKSVKEVLDDIEVTLKSNYQMLLTETDQFNNQLDTLIRDLMECSRKINFLFKINNNQENADQLGQLKIRVENLHKELQIFIHINTLKNLEKLHR